MASAMSTVDERLRRLLIGISGCHPLESIPLWTTSSEPPPLNHLPLKLGSSCSEVFGRKMTPLADKEPSTQLLLPAHWQRTLETGEELHTSQHSDKELERSLGACKATCTHSSPQVDHLATMTRTSDMTHYECTINSILIQPWRKWLQSKEGLFFGSWDWVSALLATHNLLPVHHHHQLPVHHHHQLP